jgi:hypothetical protein
MATSTHVHQKYPTSPMATSTHVQRDRTPLEYSGSLLSQYVLRPRDRQARHTPYKNVHILEVESDSAGIELHSYATSLKIQDNFSRN